MFGNIIHDWKETVKGRLGIPGKFRLGEERGSPGISDPGAFRFCKQERICACRAEVHDLEAVLDITCFFGFILSIKEQVIFWLEQFKDGNIEDEDFRRQLIDLFVNSVTVWDEPDDYFKITIAYNLTSLQDKTYRLPKGGTLSDLIQCAYRLKSANHQIGICRDATVGAAISRPPGFVNESASVYRKRSET